MNTHEETLLLSQSFEYVLYYFPIRGRGELPRMIMEVGDLKYSNVYPKDWPKEKPDTPFGQLPVLTIINNGEEVFKLAQSGSINRYLARKAGIAGHNERLVAELDSLYETLVDITTPWTKIAYGSPEDKKLLMDNFFANQFEPWSAYFERFLKHSSGNFIGGDNLTYIDLFLFIIIESWLEVRPELLSGFENMRKIYHNVRHHPKVSAYLSSSRRHKPRFS